MRKGRVLRSLGVCTGAEAHGSRQRQGGGLLQDERTAWQEISRVPVAAEPQEGGPRGRLYLQTCLLDVAHAAGELLTRANTMELWICLSIG